MLIKNINLYLLWGAGFLGAGLNFLIQVILANNMTQRDYGFLITILVVCGFCIPIISFGLPQYLLKNGRLNKDIFIENLKKSILVSALASITLVFIFISICLTIYDASYLVYIAFVAFVFGQVLIEYFICFNQIIRNNRGVAIGQCVSSVVRLVILAIFLFFSSVSVLTINTVATIFSISSIFISIYILKKISFFNFDYMDYKSCLQLVLNSRSFLMMGILFLLYYQVDILIIWVFLGADFVALYNIPLLFISAIAIIPSVLFQKFLMPELHQLYLENHNSLYLLFKKYLSFTILVTLVVVSIMYIMGKFLLNTLFPLYAQQVYSLYIWMLVIIPLVFFIHCYGSLLNLGEHSKQKVRLMFVTVIINVVLNLLVINRYQLQGVIISTIVSYLFLVISYIMYSHRYILKTKNKEVLC
jgi:O-antigen/teichoic acid export membrane protein